MPTSQYQILRFRIINEELGANAWVKTSTLQKIIKERLGKSFTERAIQKDIKTMMAPTGMNAPIEYDHKKKAYKYTKSFTIEQIALLQEEIEALKFYGYALQLYSEYSVFKDYSNAIEKIVSGFSIKQNLSKETNANLIIQTDTAHSNNGSEFLELIVRSIDSRKNISFQYAKFNSDDEIQERQISPYLVKEYRNRWYVLGAEIKNKKIKTFALDRIKQLTPAPGIYFEDKSFHPKQYFEHCFGITSPEKKPLRIVLRFSGNQVEYVKSLPIHSTQKLISEQNGIMTISINVIPSYELFEYILGKLPDVKVISPLPIANKIRSILIAALDK